MTPEESLDLFAAESAPALEFFETMLPRVVDETLIVFLQVLDAQPEYFGLTITDGQKLVPALELTENLGSACEMEGGWVDRFAASVRLSR